MQQGWPGTVELVEHGALDQLSPAEIDDLAAEPGDVPLVTRLRDGTEVVLRADAVHERVREIVRSLDEDELDFLVLLCTGRFDDLCSRHFLLESQRVVDAGVAALSRPGKTVGTLLPAPGQTHADVGVTSHASPYAGDRFEEAAAELSAADVIVLHCMGYSLEHKRRVAAATGKPVLLAREMVASAVGWLLR